MKVGLENYQHEAGECYTRKIADHWEDGRNCGDPRCELANGLRQGGLLALSALVEECRQGLGLDRRPFRDELTAWVEANYGPNEQASRGA